MGLDLNLDKIRILALDSSSRTGSVALCEAETLVAESRINIRSNHSQTLLEQIDTLLKASGWRLTDIDLLAVVNGPGAFTGLRVGLATVKGMAQALNLPVVTVSSLRAVAMNLPLQVLPVCAFLDARKNEVYSRMFQWQKDGPAAISEARVLPPEQVLEVIDGEVVLVGDGVPVYRSLIEKSLAHRVHLAPACTYQIQASRVAWLALRDARLGLAGTAGEIVPAYIRPADAEPSKVARQNP